MPVSRWLASAMVFGMAVQSRPAWPEDRSFLQNGSYEITARLELPHLERWAVDKTTIICLPPSLEDDKLPIPIVSANNPFAKCSPANLLLQTRAVEYDIICPGRGAAKGHAVYLISNDTFSGRVAMVLGAKNMTMTELQEGRRTGNCAPFAAAPAALN